MSKLNKIFQSVPVKIPDRSGFDLSHESLFTTKVGTITPASVFEVLPGDTFSIGAMQKVTLPPFAVPFMGRIDACLEAFFIPNRLLWKGWQAFITQNNGVQSASYNPGLNPIPSSGTSPFGVPTSVPVVDISASSNSPYVGNSSLAHYLGVKIGDSSFPQYTVSALPFLAYHKVCDDWYRDENNMKPFFCKNPLITSSSSSTQSNFVNLLPHFINSASAGTALAPVLSLAPSDTSINNSLAQMVDMSIGLGSLRQRCWAKDYFTTATTRPQAGTASSVTFDTSGNTGSFTIATLRAANSLQKWLERNNIAGTDYGGQILSHFGVTPPDAVLDKAVLLGQQRMPVVVGSVENNNGTPDVQVTTQDTKNPFGAALGSAAGFGSGFDKGSLVDEFTAKEHGFIMIMFSLVPHAYYDTGIDRTFLHRTYGDFAWPEFANIGDQPILTLELSQNEAGQEAPITEQDIFGYAQRYVEYKMKLDRVSGLLEEGQNLSVYALKRGFDNQNGNPALGKDFLTIPVDYLDQVSNVNTKVSEFGCICDVYFDARALRVLPEYSLPSL